MWAILQEYGNSTIAMHLLEKLDHHSDKMRVANLKNLDGMSLGETIRFHFSYASVRAKNNEFFEFICLIKCL